MSDHLLESISWTLLHSLWQGLLVSALLAAILPTVPTRFSSLRYNLVLGCYFSFFAACLVTFTFIFFNSGQPSVASAAYSSTVQLTEPILPALTRWNVAGRWNEFHYLVSHYRHWIVLGWILGTVSFAMRYTAGLVYVHHLKRTAWPVHSNQLDLMQEAGKKLGISRIIQMVESASIHVPMVVGYLKPLVLMPAGMLAGLTPAQVEAILIHELSHIRRNDFLINLVQSAIEVVLFFNPFVWWISSRIRQEREHCCDDEVVSHLPDAQSYADTLCRLAEYQVKGIILAPALSPRKNELFNRISRIMEKSTTKQKVKAKFLPAMVLILAGFACVSWISIKPAPEVVESILYPLTRPDTVIKGSNKKEKSASYTRQSITVYDNQGKPHEEITEEFKGDEELRTLAPIPSFPNLPEMPEAGMLNLPFPSAGVMIPDTIPGFHFSDGEQDWKAFGEAFEKEFKSRFGDFYQGHAAEFEKIMKDLEGKFGNEQWRKALDESQVMNEKEWQKMMQSLQKLDQSAWQEQLARRADELKNMADNLSKMGRIHEEALRNMDLLQSDKLQRMEEQVKKQGAIMKEFEHALTEQLRKDGYLGENEALQTLDWDDHGDIKINGKELKEADQARYRELHRKYFESGGRFRYVQ